MIDKTMKVFIVGDIVYEIVDEQARNNIAEIIGDIDNLENISNQYGTDIESLKTKDIEIDNTIQALDDKTSEYFNTLEERLAMVGGTPYVLRYDEQALTNEEQSQARTNINAFSAETGKQLIQANTTINQSLETETKERKSAIETLERSLNETEVSIQESVQNLSKEVQDNYQTLDGQIQEISTNSDNNLSQHNTSSDAHKALFDSKQDIVITKYNKDGEGNVSGEVDFTVEDNTDYKFTNVTKFTMTGANVECHGFVSFGTILNGDVVIDGFTKSIGDDILESNVSNQLWEFSVYPSPIDTDSGCIIWKNWSDD